MVARRRGPAERRDGVAQAKYRMVGFGWDGPELWKGVTAGRAQQIAVDNDLHGYLLHPPWLARRKKRPEERTPRSAPYKQTSCRRLMFTVLLNHKVDHIPNAEELRTR